MLLTQILPTKIGGNSFTFGSAASFEGEKSGFKEGASLGRPFAVLWGQTLYVKARKWLAVCSMVVVEDQILVPPEGFSCWCASFLSVFLHFPNNVCPEILGLSCFCRSQYWCHRHFRVKRRARIAYFMRKRGLSTFVNVFLIAFT